ncbi:MAG: electron transfer flavoprotein subunit beta/FixA family protein [Clostridiales bacterium]|jgi:electron transfer flavoprotein beta subunit|nr:electron transfer flavoprotein subunit beta/FixA family protein [Clostridiales bacterium]
MKIIVCIKQVPDTNEVRIDPIKGTLIREGVPSIINPDDLCGLEAALALKDAHGFHITALSMGPPQADVALREALAMGCDAAFLVSDRAFGGADTWATSKTLAGAIQKLGFDLIITGRQAIDGDTAQVGPQIAEHLGIPQATYAHNVEKVCGENAFVVERLFEDCRQKVKVKAPCLITAISGAGAPRYMTVAGIVAAYDEKTVDMLTFEDLKGFVDEGDIGLKGSPTQVRKSYPKAAKGQGIVHEVSEDEAVEIIVNKLKEGGLI